MKYLRLLLLVFLGNFFPSCGKEDLFKGTPEFYFEETSCSNPWDTMDERPGKQVEEAVKYYLQNYLEVDFRSFRITNDGTTENCLACSCTTGKIFRFKADSSYGDILTAHGFKRKK